MPSGTVDDLLIVPAHEASADELRSIFGTRGDAARCQCQRYKLAFGEAFGNFPVEERRARLQEQTGCGTSGADGTSGLIARRGPDAVGWVAVEPRPAYVGLVRNQRVPWSGRDEDRSDPTVWAITCVFTRVGFRRRGISRALVNTAVEHARAHGARAIEAYPLISSTSATTSDELHLGSVGLFQDAGLAVIGHPTKRRAVMRLDVKQ